MNLLAASIQGTDRKAIIPVVALLSGFSVLQAMNVEISILERAASALVYFAGAVALARNWRHSRNFALVLVFLIVIAAISQLLFAVLGVTTPPVPLRDYAALTIAVVILALAVPALVWLWRHPHKAV